MAVGHLGYDVTGVEEVRTWKQPEAVDHQVPGVATRPLVIHGTEIARDQRSVLPIGQVHPYRAAPQHRPGRPAQAIEPDVVGIYVAGEVATHLQAPRVVVVEFAVVQADIGVQEIETVGAHHPPVAAVARSQRIDQRPHEARRDRQLVRPFQGDVGRGQVRAAFWRASGVPFEEVLGGDRQPIGHLCLG
ncbi:hypothetical protein D3C80_1144350 [compost metagenome]